MRRLKAILVGLVVLAIVVAATWYVTTTNIAVLNPKGTIAKQEMDLILLALGLSLIVVIPVFVLTFSFAWRYREGNKKAKYSPKLDHNIVAETIWWLVPSALILVLAIVTWNSSHALDPYKLLDSGVKPVTIQVVALDWKWLFIYPDSGVATVNYLRIPDKTPINFEVTSDAPMNSFWIPQLGGQIYAMPGMSTQLHLMANGAGSYNGVSANISGLGFSGMNFVTTSSSANDYTAWLMTAQKSSQHLSMDSYMDLAKPSQNNATTTYSQTMHGLYDIVVNGSMGQMMGMGM